MSIAGFVLSLILLILVLAVVIAPILRNATRTEDAFRDKQRERAIAYYERVLTNIRDLDDDLATGKIAEAEYEYERERWVNRGVQILKLLDQLDENKSIVDDKRANDAAIDAAIEESIVPANQEAS